MLHSLVFLLLKLTSICNGAQRYGVKVVGTTVSPDFTIKKGQYAAECPKDHPYSINNYTACCASATEKSSPSCNSGQFVQGHTSDQCCEPVVPCSGKFCRGTAEGNWASWSTWTLVGSTYCHAGSIKLSRYRKTSLCLRGDGYPQICRPPRSEKTTDKHLPKECKAYTKLLIFGGRKGYDPGSQAAHLLDAKSQTVCRLADLPQGRYANIMGIIGEDAVTCAGIYDYTKHSTCYKYLRSTNTWDTSTIPDFPGYVTNPGTVQLPQGGFIVIGGSHGGARKEVRYYDIDTHSFRDGPSLPVERQWPCPVLLNSTHVLVGGGSTGSMSGFHADVLVLDITDLPGGTWQVIASLPFPRKAIFCGSINQQNDLEVVFAGGFATHDQVEKRVDVLNLGTMTWRLGPELPQGLGRGASAQVGDTMLILGGSTATDSTGEVSTIYQLDWANSAWIRWSGELTEVLKSIDAVVVPEDDFSCP